MKIKLKKLSSKAVIPTYAKYGDAGMDLTAIDWTIEKDIISYYTGIAVEIPEGFVGYVFPRSSIHKQTLALANSVAVIDSGYRGELICKFRVTDTDDRMSLYQVGERIAQLVIMPVPYIQFEEVEELVASERGEGGFGSSGI